LAEFGLDESAFTAANLPFPSVRSSSIPVAEEIMRNLLKSAVVACGVMLLVTAGCSETTAPPTLQAPDEVLATTESTTFERYWWTGNTYESRENLTIRAYDSIFPFRLVRYRQSTVQTVDKGNGICPWVGITYAENDPAEDPDHRGRLCSFVEKDGAWYNIYYEFTLYYRPDGIATPRSDEVEKGRLLAREKTRCSSFPCQPKGQVEVLDPLGLTGVFANGGLVEALLNTPKSSLVEDKTYGYLLYVWLGGRLFWTESDGEGGTDPEPKCTPGMEKRGLC
jgi:hypothetical protein